MYASEKLKILFKCLMSEILSPTKVIDDRLVRLTRISDEASINFVEALSFLLSKTLYITGQILYCKYMIYIYIYNISQFQSKILPIGHGSVVQSVQTVVLTQYQLNTSNSWPLFKIKRFMSISFNKKCWIQVLTTELSKKIKRNLKTTRKIIYGLKQQNLFLCLW